MLAEHDLPSSDLNTVMTWSRHEVVGQEWIDLASIITENPSPRSANDKAVYQWFQGVYLNYEVAQTQAAVNEYLKWSGLTQAEVLAGDDPISDGYCNYVPPGGLGDNSYTDADNKPQNCYQPSAEIISGCAPSYPTADNFEQWGAYDAFQQNAGLTSPAAARELVSAAQVGLGATVAQAPAGEFASNPFTKLGSGGTLSTAGNLLDQNVYPQAFTVDHTLLSWVETGALTADLLNGALFAYLASIEAVADAIGLVADVVPVVGAVIDVIVTTVAGSLELASDESVHQSLETGLSTAQSDLAAFTSGGSGPDLNDLMANHGATNALYELFLAQTLPDVSLDCANSNVNCVTIPPTPIPGPQSSDPQFDILAQGAAQSTLTSSIYTASPLGLFDSTRISGNGWFVTHKYDPTDPNNLNNPNGRAGGTNQGLSFEYTGWDKKAWLATIVHNASGAMLFAETPLDSSDQNACLQQGAT